MNAAYFGAPPSTVAASIPSLAPPPVPGGSRPLQMTAGGPPAPGNCIALPGWLKQADEKKVRWLREYADKYGRDPRMRYWVFHNVLGGDKNVQRDYAEQVRRVLSWVQENITYINETGELFQSPWVTIRERIGDCLPEGTLLLTDKYELVPIERVRAGTRIWGWKGWTTVKRTWSKGPLPTRKVTLSNGSTFRATADHHVFVRSCELHGPTCPDLIRVDRVNCKHREKTVKRIPLSELQTGMVLITPDRIDYGHEPMDPERAWVEGLYIADGWTSHHHTRADGSQVVHDFSIAGKDGHPKEAQKHAIRALCEKWGIPYRMHWKSITVNDAEWATTRMDKMGRKAPEKHALSIGLNEAAAKELLRGLLADADVRDGVFTTTSQALAMQVRLLLKMAGITCRETYIKKHGGLGKNPIWRLTPRKLDKPRRLQVKAIESDGLIQPCWDITTEDGYVYLPEADVTVSNCDDMLLLTGSMLTSIGLPWRIALGGITRGSKRPARWLEPWPIGKPGRTPRNVDFAHIYLAVGDKPFNPQQWIAAEPTIRGAPLGYDPVYHGPLADSHMRGRWTGRLPELGATPDAAAAKKEEESWDLSPHKILRGGVELGLMGIVAGVIGFAANAAWKKAKRAAR